MNQQRIQSILTTLKRIGLVVSALMTITTAPVFAQAVNTDDINAIRNDTPWFGPCLGQGDSSQSIPNNTPATASARVEAAFRYLMAHGFTADQTAGIIGNMEQESGSGPPSMDIQPTAKNPSSGAYGIAQWLGGRLTTMRSWVAATGQSPDSLNGQLDYLMHELETTEGQAFSEVKKTTTASTAADAWGTYFERYGNDGSAGKRENNAIQTLAIAQQKGWTQGNGNTSTSPTASATNTTGCIGGSTSGSPDCQSASGNAKILCEAEKYMGIYYQWGGGHMGYADWRKQCPFSLLGSLTAPGTAAANSNPSNTGSCATDCSGLVSVAVDAAFGKTFSWVVSDVETSSHWTKVPIPSASAGDVVTVGSEHIEIVDHVTSDGTVYTFGSHHTGSKTSPSQAKGYYDAAWRYIP